MSMRDLSQKSLKITLQLPHLPISFRYVVRNNSVQLVGLMSPVKVAFVIITLIILVRQHGRDQYSQAQV